ncbi:V-type ATP synthase subunit C [Anaerosphaera multitolerans]|uniref:V-type ATP synthase subunit C n=1 Tax=Anaerosphaera multitolerans TaxID=2487351 RepID=A0A437S4K9_9FIRM|nr:V-type ATP synthase subunit C [Anaerosphaera multitolerans]RVU53934.1 V-type ATP synthase subunit C [Anaerosphaera multitolerans]
MDRNAFVQLSTTTRVLEKKLLNRQTFDRLVEAEDLEDALKILSDSTYQQFISKLENPKDYEQALKEEEQSTYEEYYKVCPDKRVVDLLTLKYFYHNLKVLAKEKILNEDFRHILIDMESFNMDEIIDEIEGKKKYPEKNECIDAFKRAMEVYEETENPQNIDTVLDKMYFEKLKSLAEEMEVDLFKRYVKDLIDFTNIDILLRCQRQERTFSFLSEVLIEGGNISQSDIEQFYSRKIDEQSPLFKSNNIFKAVSKGIEEYNQTGSLSMYEKEKDNYFMDLIKEVRGVVYGPEVVFAYLFAKDMEIKNLRFILISKENKLNPSFIRERLRDSYV